MQLPFFYEPTITAITSFLLSEETSKHCIQVLRMKQGQALKITDGKGNLYTAVIVTEDKKYCSVQIQSNSYNQQQQRVLSIGISLLKNTNRFEWLLEKATELGVSEIIPLLCKRTERQHFRFDRMNNILVSAMLQSQQTWLPILHQPIPVQQVISSSAYQQKLIAHCVEDEKIAIKNLSLTNHLQILIGPEGDFTHEEIQLALQNNYQPVSLGTTRLRTETAGITAAALLMNY